MITISILYPNTPGSRFDIDYYVDKHMPMSIALLGTHPGFRGVSVERGLGGAAPGSAADYSAMCHFRFDSVEDFMAAFSPHAAALQADIANYTDVAPIIQFNEVLISV
jgi:uncharacterized protein (TIGR02118 family)